MEKIWVKDIKEGERVKGIFAIARKAVPTAKSGKTYLAATLVDRTGEIEARSFDRVEELAALFEENDLVEVEGLIGSFQGKPQLRVESVAKVDPAAAGLDAADFAWVPAPEPRKPEKAAAVETSDANWTELLGLVEAITDVHVKELVKAFLADDDLTARLRRAPAAKSVHHAYPGGLLEHTVSCIKLSHRVADQYPQLDRDLLVAGAFFHDLGKIRELAYERSVEYTDEGRLVGHLVMAAQWIHDKARRVGVPRELEQHVVHLVLSHHGKLEYGSPKTPATLEALVTHFIDDLDSRMNSWVGLMGRDGGSRRWTDSQNIYGHNIWRGTLPTAQVEKKVAAAGADDPGDLRPEGGAAGTGAAQGAGEEAEAPSPREAGAIRSEAHGRGRSGPRCRTVRGRHSEARAHRGAAARQSTGTPRSARPRLPGTGWTRRQEAALHGAAPAGRPGPERPARQAEEPDPQPLRGAGGQGPGRSSGGGDRDAADPFPRHRRPRRSRPRCSRPRSRSRRPSRLRMPPPPRVASRLPDPWPRSAAPPRSSTSTTRCSTATPARSSAGTCTARRSCCRRSDPASRGSSTSSRGGASPSGTWSSWGRAARPGSGSTTSAPTRRTASSDTSRSASRPARHARIRKHLLSATSSSSPPGRRRYIVDEVARHLRVHGAIGTRTRAVDGKATPDILPPMVFQDGKREAVSRALDQQGLDLARSWLYSDSPADVPLFEAVGHPVVVNPKESFRAVAEQRGWPVVTWKERNKEAQADLASEWSSWDG